MQRDDRKNLGKLTNGHGGNGATPPASLAPLEPRFVIEQGAAAPPQPSDNSVLIRAILAAFRRRWLLATSLGLTCAAAAAVAAWFLIPAPYTAFAEIRIHSRQPRLIFSTDDRAHFEVYKQTHMRLLKSYFVLQSAIRPPEIAQLTLIRNEPHPVDWLEKNLVVSSPAQEFVRVSLSGENPKELAAIVDAVVVAYRREVLEKEEEGRRQRLSELEKVHLNVKREVDRLHDDFKRQAELMQVPNTEMGVRKQQFLLDRYLETQKQYTNIDFEIIKAQAQLDVMERISRGESTDEIEIAEPLLEAQLLQMPEYQRAAAKVAAYEEFFARQRKRIDENRPDAIRPYEETLNGLRQELARKREELLPAAKELATASMVGGGDGRAGGAESLRQRIASLDLNRQRLREELDKIEHDEGALGRSTLELDTITRQMERKEAVAKALSDQVDKLAIELNSPLGVDANNSARVPHERNMKKKFAGTAGGGFGMFGLIVGGIVLLEVRARRISSLDQVAGGLNVRVLGSVPAMPRSVTTATNGKKTARNAFWNSLLGESIDATRTMLLREARDAGRNVVMVASAMGGEGKTTLCCHLATSLAKARRRVLLVDGDLRRPTVHRVFGLPQGPGVCEVLRGEAKLEEVVQTLKSGLSILPAGKINQDVLQILAQDGMDAILKELRQQYDFVLLDSSPVLPVTDSLLVAQHVDGIIFAIRRDVSRAAKVAAAMQRMEMLGVPLLGAVVIGLDDDTGGFGYGYRYNYGYAYGARNPYHSALPAR